MLDAWGSSVAIASNWPIQSKCYINFQEVKCFSKKFEILFFEARRKKINYDEKKTASSSFQFLTLQTHLDGNLNGSHSLNSSPSWKFL